MVEISKKLCDKSYDKTLTAYASTEITAIRKKYRKAIKVLLWFSLRVKGWIKAAI